MTNRYHELTFVIDTPWSPVAPVDPVMQTGAVVVGDPDEYVTFVRDHMYVPSNHAGAVVDHDPPVCVVLEVER